MIDPFRELDDDAFRHRPRLSRREVAVAFAGIVALLGACFGILRGCC